MSRLVSISQTPVVPVSEPITLDVAKAFLRIDFTDDDDLINALITTARMKCEKILGLVLIDTNIKALYQASYAGHHEMRMPAWSGVLGTAWGAGREHKRKYELFYGPILDESGVPAIDGLPDDAEIKGHGTSVWVETYAHELDITYSSGWGTAGIPGPVKTAILKQIAWDYEHRGDEASMIRKGGLATTYETSISPETASLLRPFSVNMSDIIL